MSVGDYLMYHATIQERRNFETLMEVLQDFKRRRQKATKTLPSNPVRTES